MLMVGVKVKKIAPEGATSIIFIKLELCCNS